MFGISFCLNVWEYMKSLMIRHFVLIHFDFWISHSSHMMVVFSFMYIDISLFICEELGFRVNQIYIMCHKKIWSKYVMQIWKIRAFESWLYLLDAFFLFFFFFLTKISLTKFLLLFNFIFYSSVLRVACFF